MRERERHREREREREMYRREMYKRGECEGKGVIIGRIIE